MHGFTVTLMLAVVLAGTTELFAPGRSPRRMFEIFSASADRMESGVISEQRPRAAA